MVRASYNGALVYEPATHTNNDPLLIEIQQLANNAHAIYQGTSDTVLPELFRAGGSPAGARPKALVATQGETMMTAEGTIPAGFTPWLLKFNANDDFVDTGNIEYAYSLMARDAGLEMPITCLMEARYFAVQRFDRCYAVEGSHYHRVHTHTLWNMIGADFRLANLDYIDLLQVVSNITQSHTQLCNAFRQMLFNIATHNRDDHSKNFAFIWDEQRKKWRLSPAYDLMFSAGIYGEHTMTIAGEGKKPHRKHIAHVAQKFGLEKVMDKIIAEVNHVVVQWEDYAQKAGVSKKNTGVLGGYIKAL
jgi:serine/threonine-protein kinase HipA